METVKARSEMETVKAGMTQNVLELEKMLQILKDKTIINMDSDEFKRHFSDIKKKLELINTQMTADMSPSNTTSLMNDITAINTFMDGTLDEKNLKVRFETQTRILPPPVTDNTLEMIQINDNLSKQLVDQIKALEDASQASEVERDKIFKHLITEFKDQITKHTLAFPIYLTKTEQAISNLDARIDIIKKYYNNYVDGMQPLIQNPQKPSDEDIINFSKLGQLNLPPQIEDNNIEDMIKTLNIDEFVDNKIKDIYKIPDMSGGSSIIRTLININSNALNILYDMYIRFLKISKQKKETDLINISKITAINTDIDNYNLETIIIDDQFIKNAKQSEIEHYLSDIEQKVTEQKDIIMKSNPVKAVNMIRDNYRELIETAKTKVNYTYFEQSYKPIYIKVVNDDKYIKNTLLGNYNKIIRGVTIKDNKVEEIQKILLNLDTICDTCEKFHIVNTELEKYSYTPDRPPLYDGLHIFTVKFYNEFKNFEEFMSLKYKIEKINKLLFISDNFSEFKRMLYEIDTTYENSPAVPIEKLIPNKLNSYKKLIKDYINFKDKDIKDILDAPIKFNLFVLIYLEFFKGNIPINDLYNDLKSSISTFIQNLGLKTSYTLIPTRPLLGGSGLTTQADSYIKTLSDQMDNLIKLNDLITQVSAAYRAYSKKIKIYNILYIQLYNHQLFIATYITKQIFDEDFTIYKLLSKGIIQYYRSIILTITKKFNTQITDEITMFFYKYHYITLNVVLSFLNNIYPSLADGHKYNLIETTYVPLQRKNIFIFNAFKGLLDQYKLNFTSPVGIYLRINDKVKPQPINEIFKMDATTNKNLLIDNLKKCNLSKPSIYNELSHLTFEGVFDKTEIPTNSALANYMSIPTYLADNKSIMIITYGYSGVGKTFTIFGNTNEQGLLQSSLQNIQNKEKIVYRAFDLYGLGFPYKSYWNGKTLDEFNHQLFSYNKNQSSIKFEEVEHSKKDIKKYINDVANYTQLNQDDIASFSVIVEEIDKVRTEKGRIKRTSNNVVSSRSIMIYDFKITLNGKGDVSLIILDLPGKENIKETFVKKPPVNQYQCIKYKYTASLEDPNPLNEEMVRGMAYLSPLSLMLHEPFAKKMYQNNDNYLTEITVKGVTYKNDHEEYSKKLGLIKHPTHSSDIMYKVMGLETFRNIILKDDFLKLKEFYKLLFENERDYTNNTNIYMKTKYCTSSENGILAPFEGYYINENISGLLKTLLKYIKKLSSTPISDDIFNIQDNVYLDAITGPLRDSNFNPPFATLITDELTAQTYFFRIFSRIHIIKNEYRIDCTSNIVRPQSARSQSAQPKRSNSQFIATNQDFSLNDELEFTLRGECINPSQMFLGKGLEDWITNSYDYDKIYSDKASPIEIILEPYFEKMNNFYIFYVVSNDIKENCEKQITLINNAGPFLNSISNFQKKQ